MFVNIGRAATDSSKKQGAARLALLTTSTSKSRVATGLAAWVGEGGKQRSSYSVASPRVVCVHCGVASAV